MSNQYRDSKEEKFDDSLVVQKNSDKDISNIVQTEYQSDAFHSHHHARHTYSELNREYLNRLSPMFANITRSRYQFPPYWDEKKNRPEKLPLFQHNVSSGRYHHSMTQISLTYNSFFPNQSLSKHLIDVQILDPVFDLSPKQPKPVPENQAPPQSQTQQNNAVPPPSPSKPDQLMRDESALIEQAFDNVVKHSHWAKREHLKMVTDMMNYGVGLYKFSDDTGIRYKCLQITKARFPTGTTTDPSEWEYMFIEHEITFTELLNHWDTSKTPTEMLRNGGKRNGWNKHTLDAFFKGVLTRGSTTTGSSANQPWEDPNAAVEDIRKGLLGLPNLSEICPATIPLVSCYWKNKDGKVSMNTFASLNTAPGIEGFLYEKDDAYESFDKAFSVFPADDSIDEIRMVRGWGERIFHLCHAYDRSFCKFLDNIEHAATLFLDMDPNDLYQKIVNFGSITLGKFNDVKKFPSALDQIVNALVFLDAKIDSVTFTRGLNKTELMGEGRGAELATILLTMEGRVHKHLMSRFHERYTIHYREVLRRMLEISLRQRESSKTLDREVIVKFKEWLENRGVAKEQLQGDDTSDVHNGLPSNWQVVARQPDGTGITSTTPHVIQALQPYLSSLPESGFKYLLARVISDAFGDEDMVHKLLPGSDIAKMTSEADLQFAETQAAMLTIHRSEFDKELNPNEDIDPRMSDAGKFITFPSAKQNDNIIFLQVLLKRVDDAVERLNRREFGRTTLHIWIYNLVSTAQGHVDDLRSDKIRSNRPEAKQLFERFGKAFNILKQVESQANADRAKKLDEYQRSVAEQAQDNPERMKALANLETARAKSADIQRQFSADEFQRALEIEKNRRAEESHIIDTQVKLSSIRNQDLQSQSLVGRPGADEQRGKNNA